MGAMSENTDVIQNLSGEESLELLATKTFGRLVVRRKDDMDLFPLNYLVHEGEIYFRTAEGSKLFSLTLNNDVLFEADNVDGDSQEAWSVVVKGTARTNEGRPMRDMPVWIVNTGFYKDMVAASLRRKAPGPGYAHIPAWIKQACPGYFDELRAEVR